MSYQKYTSCMSTSLKVNMTMKFIFKQVISTITLLRNGCYTTPFEQVFKCKVPWRICLGLHCSVVDFLAPWSHLPWLTLSSRVEVNKKAPDKMDKDWSKKGGTRRGCIPWPWRIVSYLVACPLCYLLHMDVKAGRSKICNWTLLCHNNDCTTSVILKFVA